MRRFFRDDEVTDNQEGKVDPRYLAEVERMTRRRQRFNERRESALRALVEAEAAVVAAKATRRRAVIRAAWRLVEQRQIELRRIEALMTSVPGASSAHRGTRSVWPTAAPGAVQRGEPDHGPRVSDGRTHPIRVEQFDAAAAARGAV